MTRENRPPVAHIGGETWCCCCGRRAWLCARHPCVAEPPRPLTDTERRRVDAYRPPASPRRHDGRVPADYLPPIQARARHEWREA